MRDAVLGLRDLDLSEAPALNEYSPRLVNKKYREMMINRTALYLGKKAVLPAPMQLHGLGLMVLNLLVRLLKHCGNVS